MAHALETPLAPLVRDFRTLAARGEAFADIERDRFGRPFLRRAGSAPGEPAGGALLGTGLA